VQVQAGQQQLGRLQVQAGQQHLAQLMQAGQ
jgi:hypothetical protein